MKPPPPNFQNEALWRERCIEVQTLAQRILDGSVGIIEGSRQMSLFRHQLCTEDDEDFKTFVGIDSESDHLPIGKVRDHWDAKALKKKDEEVRLLENHFREKAFAAAKRIKEKYS